MPLPSDSRPDTPDLVTGGPSHGQRDVRAVVTTELFVAHYTQFVRMARLLVDDPETAEDVVMEAFASLCRRWFAIRDRSEAHRYVRSCVLNGARSQLRRRKVVRAHESARRQPGSGGNVGQDSDGDGTDRITLTRQLAALPVRQREVLVLRYYLDMSEADIAEALGISAGSVKQHASRGLAALARELEVP